MPLIAVFAMNAGSLYSFEPPKDPERFYDEIKFEFRLRTSIRYCSLNLKETKEIALPALDANENSEDAKIKLKAGDGLDMIPIRAGYSASYSLKNMDLIAGIDAEFNWGRFRDIQDESGTERFIETDDRGSGVYDKVYRDAMGLYPFFGVRFGGIKRDFEVEMALPICKFRREWGYVNEGNEQKIGSERYIPTGYEITLRQAAWDRERTWRLGVEMGFEKYRLKGDKGISGRLSSFEMGLFLEKKF